MLSHAAGKDLAKKIKASGRQPALPGERTGGESSLAPADFFKPKQPRSNARTLHLCDASRCELPPVDWWRKAKGLPEGRRAKEAALP